ncbi:membrane dipeptidase, partial [Hominenteromicrobium sp.]
MRYFDLHCDTLVECLSKGKSLLRNDLHVSVEKGARFAPYIQCAAVWLPDTVRGAEAFAYFERHADFLDCAAESGAFRLIRTGADVEALENARGVGLMLTVEGGAAIAGKLEN